MAQNKDNSSRETIAVIGLGRSGIAAAKLLKREGKKVIILDKSESEDHMVIAEDLREIGISVELGKPLKISSFEPWLPNISEVIISPSIPWDNKTINQLRDLDIKIKGEICLAWERIRDVKWIGITGTNGKTTVTEMLQYIMSKNNIRCDMAGNIGRPTSEICLQYINNPNSKADWLIVELSSYQIESAKEIAPEIGIWTTFTPDHLERHKNMENYFKIKKNLLDKSSIRIYNLDDKNLRTNRKYLNQGIWVTAKPSKKKPCRSQFWISQEGIVCEGDKKLFHSSIIKVPGSHNLQNLLMVTAAARKIGLSSDQIETGLSDFKGVPHRLEYLGKINDIKFFNDSKATNYDAATIGLNALEPLSIVLAGGEAKKGNHKEWTKQLKERSCGIFLFGASALELKKLITKSGYKKQISIHQNLEEASHAALKVALKTNAKNILLSPACASFDQYKDFEARGNHFKNLFNKFRNLEISKEKNLN